ncbi:MAG TPA: hypothetical protein VMU04_17910 [Candidatus Acidoferrum sp.]|nr:hypothetical protein [Candidatus Acidoferrum sp.]
MRHYLMACGAMACLALAPSAFAYVQPDNSMLYLPNESLTSLPQSTYTGTVGGIFYTPYYYNVNINWLGYADPTGAPLEVDHTVTIWNHANGTVVASAVVPAGDPTIYDGYAWVSLPSTVTLTYQHYYDIGASVVGGVDPWGSLFNNSSPDPGANGQITWNVVNGVSSGDPNSPMVQAGSGWEFTRAGVYDVAGNYPTMPPNQVTSAGDVPDNGPGAANGPQDSIYPAANMGYNLIPEPTSLALAGMAGAMLLGRALKRKA